MYLQLTNKVCIEQATTFSSTVASAAEIAYFTYIYAKVDRERYQQVTSNSRSACLFGRSTGAMMSQFFMMYGVMNAQELIYISLGSEYQISQKIKNNRLINPLYLPDKCVALMLALFLPAVTTSIYFYQAKKKPNNESTSEISQEKQNTVEIVPQNNSYECEDVAKELVKFSWKDGKTLLTSHLKSAWSNKIVLLWSVWWVLLHSGYLLMYSYNQPLWHFIEPERTVVYNGFAETGMTLFGALGALLAAKLSQKFIEKWAIWIVVVCSIGMGSFSIIAGQTTSVFVSYAMYVCLGALYHFMITVTR